MNVFLLLISILFLVIVGLLIYANMPAYRPGCGGCRKPQCDACSQPPQAPRMQNPCNKCGMPKPQCHCPKKECPFC